MAGYKVPHFSVNCSVLKVAVQVTHHVADGFAVCMRGPVDHVGAEPSQRGRRDSTSGGSCTVRSAPGSSAAMRSVSAARSSPATASSTYAQPHHDRVFTALLEYLATRATLRGLVRVRSVMRV